ncbi:MAG: DUF2062 domain-containing protein [Desulfobacterales bacterium]|nr:DUF2062 domain-containing protein [Desulfobacterales bacterium]
MNGEGRDIRVLLAMAVHESTRDPAALVRRARDAHDRVLVVDGADIAGEMTGSDVHLVSRPGTPGRGEVVRAGIEAAHEMGATHLVVLDPGMGDDPDDFNRFPPLIRESPDAVIVGARDFQSNTASGRAPAGGRIANIVFRIQTGQSLKDAAGSFRAYPLAVLDNLKLYQRGRAFDVEVLVKAAWAGVQIREVDVSWREPSRPGLADRLLTSPWIGVLNFHYIMRSITPLPHRKIVEAADAPGSKISALHPIRSLKTLLTENITPGRLAAAGALGVYLGALPLLMFHTVAILLAANFFRLNKVAAVSASQLCMPPLVPALCIEAGYFMRHGKFLTEFSLETIGYQALERLYEWVIGSMVLAPALAAVAAGVIYVAALLVNRTLEKPGKRV